MTGGRLEEGERLEALRRSGLLCPDVEPKFDRIARLASRLLEAPTALVSLLEPHRQFFKSAVGLPESAVRETPLSHSFCKHVVMADAPLVVNDARVHPLVRDNGAVGDLGVVAYLGVPLRTPGGAVLGSLCVIDHKPRAWEREDVDVLEDLVTTLTDELALREEMRQRAVADRRREEAEAATIAARRLKDASLDAISDLFFVLDDEARLTEWNRRCVDVTGYTDDELRGMDVHRLFDGASLPRIAAAIERALCEGRAVEEAVLVSKDGHHVPYEFNATALLDANGEVTGLCGTGRDITERKRAERRKEEDEQRLREQAQALEEANERFESVISNVPGVVYRCVYEPDGTMSFPFMRAGLGREVGIDWSVLEQQPQRLPELLRTLIHPDDAAALDALLDTRPDDSALWTWEARLIVNGEVRWFSAASHPQRLADGRLARNGLFLDVTAQKEAEEALRESEVRFRSFVEATAQVVWQADEAGAVTELSEAWSAFTGQAPEEIEGWGWTDALHPDDRPRVMEESLANIEARTPYEAIFRVRRSDGAYHRFFNRSVPVFAGDAFLGWVGTCTDVEEQLRADEALFVSEERLRLALGAAEMGTWDTHLARGAEPGDHTVAWSAQTCALFGYSDGAAEVDKSVFYDLIVEEDRERVRAQTEAAARCAERGGGAEFAVEYRLRRGDGAVRWFRSTGRVILGADERAERMTGTVLDITDAKAYEAALIEAKEAALQAQREAEASARTKNALLANMSHEIRTPLTAIIGFSDILAVDAAEEHGEFARLIGVSGRRLLETLNSVLDFARLEAGEAVVEMGDVDLGEIVTRATMPFGPCAKEKGLELVVALPDEPVTVRADGSALDRVVTNLVSNAVKFTDEGTVEVSVTVEGAEGEGAASIRVRDTGVGIDDAFLPRLFEEFCQESEGDGRGYEGSGLGLSITKRLVERLGGEIEVESAKGRGSTFTVRLPLAG